MAIKLKSFDTLDYFHVCGMHMKRFGAGVKGNVRIDYHHPHGVMVHRDGKTSEFIPIHNIKTVTPMDIEDLQAILDGAPSIEGIDGPITDAPPKRKRRTKAEMEAATMAAS